ncbi:MAG: hypothetical protein CNE94_03160 [Rhodobacteraceae bacterium MED-G07]|nr:MAG: hypothetical protein CNE94_03160 [Rhodobacteraceae bacterium MED-G07]
MSDTDNFIEEVSEEVRRDRLYNFFRKYAWVGVLVVLTIVGGTAFLEYQKATVKSKAEKVGSAVMKALERSDEKERAELLANIESSNPEVKSIVAMLKAAEEIALQNYAAASKSLKTISEDSSIGQIYRDIAEFKFLLLSHDRVEDALLLTGFEKLASPGNPFRLLAEEQIAIIELKNRDNDAAVAKLRSILEDAELTDTIRQRVTQLLISIGIDPSSI